MFFLLWMFFYCEFWILKIFSGLSSMAFKGIKSPVNVCCKGMTLFSWRRIAFRNKHLFCSSNFDFSRKKKKKAHRIVQQERINFPKLFSMNLIFQQLLYSATWWILSMFSFLSYWSHSFSCSHSGFSILCMSDNQRRCIVSKSWKL